jgi:hypothetical protein
MTWDGDKKEVLSKLVDIYQEIDETKNRYDASLLLLKELDFFVGKLVSDDPVISEMVNIDREWFHMYLTQMSDLMGEEL